jgi:hypothetical protein
VGRHSIPDPGDPLGGPGEERPARQGRRRRADGGPRGVSTGVIAAVATVVALVTAVILWQFFGDALSRRAGQAAGQCLAGTDTVPVVADASIAEQVREFAGRFNDETGPVGDTCVEVVVTEAESDAVVTGLTGTWSADAGEQPALWIPASSVSPARLQAAVGPQVVSDARSLATSPVTLAVRPQLRDALGTLGWPALPGLQTNPTALDGLGLPDWGSLRLALPSVGGADSAYLVAEAVAATSAPPGSPVTSGLAAAGAVLAGAPRLSENTEDTAWNALIDDGDPAVAPVHALAITEQQLYRRATALPDAPARVAAWFPGGPSAVADYPAVLLAGPWLTEEQVTAASQFARFIRQEPQQTELAEAGFRVEGAQPLPNDVVAFGPLGDRLAPVADAERAAVASAAAPAAVATTTVMLNAALGGEEDGTSRLDAVTAALRNRVAALPGGAAVGLWTFNGVGSGSVVATGPLADPVDGRPRSTLLTGALDGLGPQGSGGVSFTTLRLVYADALANYRPGQRNSVLVVTQGPHTDRSLDGPGLQEFVRSSFDPNRPVAIDVVTFAGDPDRPTWEAVAQLSGGGYTEVPGAQSPDLVVAVSRGLA